MKRSVKNRKASKILIAILNIVVFVCLYISYVFAEGVFPTHFYDHDGNLLKDTIVYYDGELYAWDGKQVIKNAQIEEKSHGNGKKVYYADKDGKIVDAKGLSNVAGRTFFYDYHDSSLLKSYTVHGKNYLIAETYDVLSNAFYYYSNNKNGISDKKGFKITKPGIYNKNNIRAYIRPNGNMATKGLYNYKSDTFLVAEGSVYVTGILSTSSIAEYTEKNGSIRYDEDTPFIIEKDEKKYLAKDVNHKTYHTEKDNTSNKRYIVASNSEIVSEKGFFNNNKDIYYILDDLSYAFDEIVENKHKKYLFNKEGLLVTNDLYMLSDGYIYLTNENGEVVTKEGMYRVSRYDIDGVFDEDSFNKRCYVDDKGHVVYNDFVFLGDKVYYATENGTFLRNSALANRYYFNENYELTTKNVTRENVAEAKKWIWYSDIKGIKYRDEIKIYIPKVGKVIFNREYVPNDELDLPSEDEMIKSIEDSKAYDVDGNLLKNRFINLYTRNETYAPDYIFYADKDGNFIKNKILELGDDKYVFDKNGMMVKSAGMHNFYIKECADLFATKEFAIDKEGILVEDKANYKLNQNGFDEEGDEYKYYILVNSNKDYSKEINNKFLKAPGFFEVATGDAVLGYERKEYDFINNDDISNNYMDWVLNVSYSSDNKMKYTPDSYSLDAIGYGIYTKDNISKEVLVIYRRYYTDINSLQALIFIDVYDRNGKKIDDEINFNYPFKVTLPNGDTINNLIDMEGRTSFSELDIMFVDNPGNYNFEYVNPEKGYDFSFVLNSNNYYPWVRLAFSRFIEK